MCCFLDCLSMKYSSGSAVNSQSLQMTQTSVSCLSVLFWLFITCRLATSSLDSVYFDYLPVVYTYNHLSEIEKECIPFLSSASELKPDDSRSYRLKEELSFFDGDWSQEPGGAPLMPFDDSDIPRTSSSLSSPLRLVGFEVKDVNPVHQLQNAVSVHGTMCIGIARNTTLLYDALSTFHISPGMSVLKISFERVYMETMQKGGERLLCMLGNTTLPAWNLFDGLPDMSSSSSTLSNLKHNRLLQEDRLLLVLHYPQTFSLTKRAILGELKSLNEQGNDKYLDSVHIFSQLGRYSKYEFSSKSLKSRSCNSSLYQVELEEDGVNSFNHSEFCNALRRFSGELFNIVPMWRFIGTDNYSGRFGPFLFEQDISGDDMSYENVRLIIQDLICEQETTQFMVNSARVAAVFRVFPAQQMDRSIASMRTALSSMTLSVEGTWEASKGKLCMAGCLGVADAGLEECGYQVSLYFPRSLSIKQRSFIFGSISSIRSERNSYIPIIFKLGICSTDLFYNHAQYARSYLSYNYSKIELAGALRKKNQLPGFFTAINKLVLKYPALPDGRDVFALLNHLSYDLSIRAHGIQESLRHRDNKPEIFIEVEVVSLGPLLGHYFPWLHGDGPPVKGQVEISKSELLNVSLSLMFKEAPLNFTGKYYRNVSELSLEGLYDPLTGEMHLIGCRKVLAKAGSFNTERGFDCLIEVKIGYPAKTMRWLINPTAKITITSQRKKEDALYFSPIELLTSMLPHDLYEPDAVFRKVFDQIFRNLMITAAVILILGQHNYIKENVDVIPYISRVMLSFQGIGYGLPLICNTKVLLPEKEYKSPNNFYGYEQLLEILDFTGKVLVLAAFLLTVTLSWKVTEFRKKHHPHLPSNSRGVPHDKQVFLVTSAIHVLGYLIYHHRYEDLFQNLRTSTIDNDQKNKILTYKKEEYIGFIQDLFLLPQIIGNIIWKTQARPLQKFYYIGFTLTRLLLLLYDCVRDPVLDPYSDETAFLNLIFTSRAPKLVVAVTMTVLAIVVYMQQKHQRLIQLPKIMAFKFSSFKTT